jgi:hypothetical protein
MSSFVPEADFPNGIDGASIPPIPSPLDLTESMERLDALLAATSDLEKLRAGMGIRLALGLAQELKSGLPLGTETGELVALWVVEYGQDSVDVAVAVAREFLTKPEDLRKALEQRLGLQQPPGLDPLI